MTAPTTTLDAFDGLGPLEPEQPRERRPSSVPASPGGLTLPVLALAAMVSSPAIWQCLVAHTVPLQVMLERYVLIALGCLLVSEVVRRLLWPPAPATPTTPTTPTGSTGSTGPLGAGVSTRSAVDGLAARPTDGLAARPTDGLAPGPADGTRG